MANSNIELDWFWVLWRATVRRNTYTWELVSHLRAVSEISSHHYESSQAAFEDSSLKKKLQQHCEQQFLSKS